MRWSGGLTLVMWAALGMPLLAAGGPASRSEQLFGVRNASLHQVTELGVAWCSGPTVTWGAIEPRRGSYNWSRLDNLVRSAGQANVQLVPIIMCFSAWGSKPELVRANAAYHEARQSGLPRDVHAWMHFASRLVERYDGDGRDDMTGLVQPVKHWQVERELPRCWADGPAELVKYLKLTEEAIKTADSSAQVVVGGLAANALYACAFADKALPSLAVEGRAVDRASLVQSTIYKQQRALVDALLGPAAASFDVLDLHPYGCWECLPQVMGWVDDHPAVKGKPKWCLQGGAPVAMYDGTATEEEVAAGVVKWYCSLALLGVQRAAWTVLPEPETSESFNETALIGTNGAQRSPWTAYTVLLEKVSGFTQVKRHAQPGLVAVEFARPSGLVVAVWASSTGMVDVSRFKIKRVTGLDGRMRPLPSKGKMELGPSPVFVE